MLQVLSVPVLPACPGTLVAGRQVGDSFSLEIFSYA